MSYPWFRLYSEVRSDAKLKWAARRAGCNRVVAMGAWVSLLCLANDSPKRGHCLLAADEPFTTEELAEELDIEPDTLERLLEQFASFGMVRWDENVLVVAMPSATDEPTRPQSKVAAWRTAVFERDDYTCQECGRKGGILNAHHVNAWFLYPSLRYDVGNGVTLCETCHSFHHARGWKVRAYTEAGR